MKLAPLGSRVIVRRLSEESRSGILIPERVKQASLVGEVLHVGEEADWVKPGDIILFGRYSGFILPVDGHYLKKSEYDECLCMNNDDILALLESEEPAPVETPIAEAVAN